MKRRKVKRWGFLASLLNQPFWWITTYLNKQWGIMLLCAWHTGACINGLRNHWRGDDRDGLKQPKVGAGCLVISGGRILLGKRLAGGLKGWWAPPGGHVEWRESAEKTACRELEEETGLVATGTELIGWNEHVVDGEDHHYIAALVRCYVPDGVVPFSKEKDKTDEWYWFDAKALRDLKQLIPTVAAFLPRIEGMLA
jgi:8-oxo-dGTP diphosphatase